MTKPITVCLFKAHQVESIGSKDERVDNRGESITLRAEYDADNPRDQSFSEYTPNGEMSFFVNNPNVLGKIEKGKKYYISITPADPEE